MRKVVSILLVVLMLSALCVSVFAEKDPFYSPTAPKEFRIDFIDYNGTSYDTVPVGETATYKANPNCPNEFEKFTIEGEYEIVEGSLDGPYIVVKPLSDLIITAHYKGIPVTTSPVDTSNQGPQTGFSPLWITIAFVALVVCAIAATCVVKRIAKKED